MATENKQVAVYLPKELENKIVDYCLDKQITRKDKSGQVTPALGTAIVEILSFFFQSGNIPSNAISNVPLQNIDITEVERIVKSYLDSNLLSMIRSLVPPQTIDNSEVERIVESKVSSILPSNVPSKGD